MGVVEVDLPARLGGLVRGGVGSTSMTAADGIGGVPFGHPWGRVHLQSVGGK